jgi:hypothetical protein
MLALCLLTSAVLVFAAVVCCDPKGLELEASHKASIEMSVHVSTISGTILNASTNTVSVPNVRIAFRDVDGAELLVRETPPSRRSLGPGDRAMFSARFANPPPDACSVEVYLVGMEHPEWWELPFQHIQEHAQIREGYRRLIHQDLPVRSGLD